ncbi:MAG TPA: cupredoxin family copper-binding protein [Solirubrobacterales bacterium]|nr:cupredoxin family copper-binding protein [Solirubrobacterales bacterium]
MRLRVLLAPLLIVLALGLAACGSDDDSTTGAADTETAPAETTEGGAAEGAAEEPGGSAPAPSGEAQRSEKVEIVEFTYQPDPVVVATGGKVIWQNEDMAPHTATADDGSFDTGTLEQGKLKAETFKEAGTFTYFCEIHPDMKGTVEVVDG